MRTDLVIDTTYAGRAEHAESARSVKCEGPYWQARLGRSKRRRCGTTIGGTREWLRVLPGCIHLSTHRNAQRRARPSASTVSAAVDGGADDDGLDPPGFLAGLGT